MSNSVFAKKSGVILAFVLFSFIFLGIIFSLTSDLTVKSGSEFSYPSWLVIAYVAGLSMIILPCTLPLVFIIIPLSIPGCSNCIVLEKILDQLGIKYDLIDVTEKPEYLEKYPIFTAPGLVIDGKLEFTGIPKKEDLKKFF